MSGQHGHPLSTPDDSGLLDVGDGQQVYWETCGNPTGAPAVVLHGGPGSGAGPEWTRLLDPAAYRIVLLDQRGCGRSTPDVADPAVPLDAHTTQHLVADLERLRDHLRVDRWLVLGASWGSTLGLAYAQRHPRAVGAVVLFSVCGTTRPEIEWITRGMRRYLPEEWARFRDAVPETERDGDLTEAYARPGSGAPGRSATSRRRPHAGPTRVTPTPRSGCASPGWSPTAGATPRGSATASWSPGRSGSPASPGCWSTVVPI